MRSHRNTARELAGRPGAGPSFLPACSRQDCCYGGREQSGFAVSGGKKLFVALEKKRVPYLYETDFE